GSHPSIPRLQRSSQRVSGHVHPDPGSGRAPAGRPDLRRPFAVKGSGRAGTHVECSVRPVCRTAAVDVVLSRGPGPVGPRSWRSLSCRARRVVTWAAGAVAVIGLLASPALATPAARCGPSVRLEGDPALVRQLDLALASRGFVPPSDGCGA